MLCILRRLAVLCSQQWSLCLKCSCRVSFHWEWLKKANASPSCCFVPDKKYHFTSQCAIPASITMTNFLSAIILRADHLQKQWLIYSQCTIYWSSVTGAVTQNNCVEFVANPQGPLSCMFYCLSSLTYLIQGLNCLYVLQKPVNHSFVVCVFMCSSSEVMFFHFCTLKELPYSHCKHIKTYKVHFFNF